MPSSKEKIQQIERELNGQALEADPPRPKKTYPRGIGFPLNARMDHDKLSAVTRKDHSYKAKRIVEVAPDASTLKPYENIIIIREYLGENFSLFSHHFFRPYFTSVTPAFHEQIYSTLTELVNTSHLGGSDIGGYTPRVGKQSLTPSPPHTQLSNNNVLINTDEAGGVGNGTADPIGEEANSGSEAGDGAATDYGNRRDRDHGQNRKHLGLVMPRQFAKSTIMWMFGLWCALAGKKKYVIYVSDSEDKAVELLKPIKHELENNKMIHAVFGLQATEEWSNGKFVAKCGTKFLARGRGQSLRGFRHLSHRPDLVILDDVENDKEVMNPLIRQECQEWVDKQVLKAIDSDHGCVVAVGTVLHFDSLMANIATRADRPEKYQQFVPLVFKALDENDKSIWEEKFSTQQLLEERRIDPYSFAQERMNNPIPVGAGMFKREYFKYFQFVGESVQTDTKKWLLNELNIYITVDLAVTDKEYSDYTVLMVTGVSHDSEIFVLEYIKDKFVDPDKVIDELFRLYSKWLPKIVGIEGVSFQKWLLVNMQKEMRRRNVFMPLQELKADRDKTRRISQLQPRFSNGAVFLLRNMGDLEEELVLFPRAPHDDIADALAYVLQVLVAPKHRREEKSDYMTWDWWKRQIKNQKRMDEEAAKHIQSHLVPSYA